LTSEDTPPDFGLVAPLAVPPDSRVPEGLADGSSPEEYDRYFRILRDRPGLPEWTRHCLRVEAELVADLDRSSLPREERGRVLEGLLAIYRVTLERWVDAAETAEARRDSDDSGAAR
jgi:hypothetical protein